MLLKKPLVNFVIYSVPRFLGYGFNLITFPILARYLDPAAYGISALASSSVIIFTQLASCGLSSAVPRFFYICKDSESKAELYFTFQVLLFVAVFLLSLLTFFLRDILASFFLGEQQYGAAFLVAYFTVVTTTSNTVYLRLYQNEGNALVHSLATSLQVIVNVVATFYFVVFRSLGYMGLLWGGLGGAIISFLFLIILFNKQHDVRGEFSIKSAKELLVYGVQVLPKTTVSYVNRFFDKYFVRLHSTMQHVGLLGISQQFAAVLNPLIDNIWKVMQPRIYALVFESQENSAKVGRLFTYFYYASIAPILVVVLFVKEGAVLLLPTSYEGVGVGAAIMIAASAPHIIGKFIAVQYAYAGRPIYLFPITVLGVLLNVVLNIVLIPKYGYVGAAFATLIAACVLNIVFVVVGQRLWRVAYDGYCIFVISAILVLALLSVMLIDVGVYSACAKAGILALYLYVGWSTKALKEMIDRLIVRRS